MGNTGRRVSSLRIGDPCDEEDEREKLGDALDGIDREPKLGDMLTGAFDEVDADSVEAVRELRQDT
ncbi:hypothetical protein [Halorussus amylolyticus]|uniref:hypothetical protein n=1 Tax=Halorussus amylolyticus TaxID=1126242 RepID=UPI001046F381|nr:hypothetical protein [Halorussus amylolyticus]